MSHAAKLLRRTLPSAFSAFFLAIALLTLALPAAAQTSAAIGAATAKALAVLPPESRVVLDRLATQAQGPKMFDCRLVSPSASPCESRPTHVTAER